MSSEEVVSPTVSTLPTVVLGAVLCGGASRRMGRDKALLVIDGQSLLERATEVVRAFGAPVILATGTEARYPNQGLECVLDRVTDGGPLAGLEAILTRAAVTGAGYVCVLACDMPRARTEAFEALLSRAAERDADVVMLSTRKGPEPLFAVYHTRCLGAVQGALAAGERRMISFHQGFGRLVVETLDPRDLPDELERTSTNVNTPADYIAETGSEGDTAR